MTYSKLTCIAISLLLFTATAIAALPQTISYQGYIKAAATGKPVTGNVPMTFSLYSSSPPRDNPVWRESQPAVSVSNGIFSVQLGSTKPLTAPFDVPYQMGIAIDDAPETITPLTSVPYALRSGCIPGDFFGCYTGPAGTLGIGACKSGIRTCRPDGTGFGSCIGEITPTSEIRDGLDNDCNGLADDNLPFCDPGTTASCYNGPAGTEWVGICRPGIRTCVADGSTYGPCTGEVQPRSEICDGLDNNCNGITDEGEVCAALCSDGIKGGLETDVDCGGICPACTVGKSCAVNSDCTSGICSGNVCQGAVCTPGSTTACYTGPIGTQGVGACHAGTSTCNVDGSAYGPCTGQVVPGIEVCDGLDNNCNGATDEGGVCGSCVDGIKNGQETDVDCGGICSTKCGIGKICSINADCSSGNCTAGFCAAADLCAGVTCTALDQCHNAGFCNPATGLCSNPPKLDGTSCNDGNACTQTDLCQSGLCIGVNPVFCSATDQCHLVGTCNPATGACSNPSKTDGTTCDDGNPATSNDICTFGICAGSN